MLYLVSYDLHDGDATDYTSLYDEFSHFDDSVRCLGSSWLVSTDLDCTAIRDRLRARMRPNDLIIVVPYDNPRSAWLSTDVVQWIKSHLT